MISSGVLGPFSHLATNEFRKVEFTYGFLAHENDRKISKTLKSFW